MVRLKNRYIVVEVNPEKPPKEFSPYPVNKDAIYIAVCKKVQQLHGDFGNASMRNGLLAKYCNEQLRIALIRVRHGPHRFVLSSLAFINVIDGKRVILKTLYIGSTMRSCFKFLIRYQQNKLFTDLAKLKKRRDYNTLCDKIMDLSTAQTMN